MRCTDRNLTFNFHLSGMKKHQTEWISLVYLPNTNDQMSAKMTLTWFWHAAGRLTVGKNVSDNKTPLRNVYCQWCPNWSTNQVTCACNFARSWSAFCDVTFYVTDLCQRPWQQGIHLALITTQQCIRSVRQGCIATVKDNWGHTRYWFCDFRNLGTGAWSVVLGANDHRMDFCLVHNIAKWSTLLKQDNWIK